MNNLLQENIMFPVFVSLYSDTNYTYMYYFRGLTESDKWIYQDFDENNIPTHEKKLNEDGSIIYIFNKTIQSIQCNLISNFKNIPNKSIFIKIF